MPFSYDLSTSIGKVRLLIPDTDTLHAVFQDDEVTAFLGMEGERVKRAAALALESIASNEALTLKVIKLLDLSTDGAKLSDSLLKRAELLRKQDSADADNEALAGGNPGWEIAQWPGLFSTLDRGEL